MRAKERLCIEVGSKLNFLNRQCDCRTVVISLMKQNPLNEIEALPNLRSLLERSAQLFSDKAVFTEVSRKGERREVSYACFLDDVRALGTALLARGYAGKRLALMGENSYAWVLAYFAIVNSGMTVVPFDKELSCEEIVDQMRRANIDAFCHTASYASEAQRAVDRAYECFGCRVDLLNMGCFSTDTLGGDLLSFGKDEVAQGRSLYELVELDPQMVCSILFTSGTTGVSKGVLLSHSNFAANIKAACELVLFRPDDTLVSVLPLHHAYEDMAGIFCPIYFGCTVGFCSGLKMLPTCLEACKPTILCLVPLYVETFRAKIMRAVKESGRERPFTVACKLSSLLQRVGIDVSSTLLSEPRAAFGGRLKLIISGGASIDASYAPFYRSLGINLIQGYGVSECSPIVSVNRNNEYKDDSIGRVVSCAQVKFDEAGQIWVKGDSVMSGYLDEPTEVLMDGWFPTGDLGYLDDEGFLYITGRCKDVIVLSNGKNIMPQELEHALTSCVSIAEAVVIGGPEKGNGPEYLVAHVYPDFEALGLDANLLTARDAALKQVQADIRATNKEQPYYKRIAAFEQHVEPFEKTTTRKIKRFLLVGKTEGMIHV